MVEIETRDPETLYPHPYNARLYRQRTPNQRFIEDVDEKMEDPLVINEDGEIIDGVRRWLAVLALDKDSVEVDERSYASYEEEKEAILRHNDDRDETFSQKMRVALQYEELVVPILEKRMKAGTSLDQQDDDPMLKSDEGATALELAGDRVDWGKDKYRHAKAIWEAKESGDKSAAKLVRQLDDDDISVNKAYQELTEDQGKGGQGEVPDEQRGITLSKGVPVDKIEADIEDPEQASFVLNGKKFNSLLGQIRISGSIQKIDDQFIHLNVSEDGLRMKAVSEVESVDKTEELRFENLVPPSYFYQYTRTQESIGISLLIDDLLSYLGILGLPRDLRFQFHGEPDNQLASALFITDGYTQIFLHSPSKWMDAQLDDPPEWIPEASGSP